jgi:hypothetical protein
MPDDASKRRVRDPLKTRAHSRVLRAVRVGTLPAPNTLPCTDCGHVWAPGDPRHEYDHWLGYAPAHWLDVQGVCSHCHKLRGLARGEYPQTSSCRVCGRVSYAYAHGRCTRCHRYVLRNGVERAPDFGTYATRARRTVCVNCGQDDPRHRFRNGRCARCDSYLRNLGSERPARLFHG